MDQERFDVLTRSIAARVNRRAGVLSLVALAAGGVAASAGKPKSARDPEAESDEKPRRDRDRKPDAAKGKKKKKNVYTCPSSSQGVGGKCNKGASCCVGGGCCAVKNPVCCDFRAGGGCCPNHHPVCCGGKRDYCCPPGYACDGSNGCYSDRADGTSDRVPGLDRGGREN